MNFRSHEGINAFQKTQNCKWTRAGLRDTIVNFDQIFDAQQSIHTFVVKILRTFK